MRFIETLAEAVADAQHIYHIAVDGEEPSSARYES
jgi:hypothetical protein